MRYLCSVMRRDEVTRMIRTAMQPFGSSVQVRLFGSEARGDARQDSDIDLLVLVDSPTVSFADEARIATPLYDVELATGVQINPIIMPRSQWGKRITPFYENVTREGRML